MVVYRTQVKDQGYVWKAEESLNEALNAIDLETLDLTNLDPSLASHLLEEIRLGADMGPIIEKIRVANAANKKAKDMKVVTFEDEKRWS